MFSLPWRVITSQNGLFTMASYYILERSNLLWRVIKSNNGSDYHDELLYYISQNDLIIYLKTIRL